MKSQHQKPDEKPKPTPKPDEKPKPTPTVQVWLGRFTYYQDGKKLLVSGF